MGIYISKYIEYRTKDGKWHLLDCYVPKTDVNSIFREEEPVTRTQDSKELYRLNEFVEKQGYWNAFLYTGVKQSPLEDRGFPEDMSADLRQIMDKMKDDSDVRGRSWFTLQELWDKYEADLAQFKSDFPAIYYESMLSATNAKLDRLQQSIVALKNNGEIPEGGNEKMDETELWARLDEFFEFNYQQLVSEFSLHHEVIHLVTDMQKYFSGEDVRVVYYLI